MKKILILALSLVIVLAFAGCSLLTITWPGGSATPPEPTLIPLRAPLHRVMEPGLRPAVYQASPGGATAFLEPAAGPQASL